MSEAWGIPVSGFTAQWRIPMMPPRAVYVGSRLRGILGHALFSEVCPYPEARCQHCAIAPYCDYTRVFKPVDATALPAYVLHDWSLSENVCSVTVLLIGAARQSCEPWIRGLNTQLPVLDWWGRGGMQLLRVLDWHSGKILFNRGKFVAESRLTVAQRWPSIEGDVEVYFVTPLVSKHQNDDPLAAALKTRIQRLRNQYGDGEQLGQSTYWSCQVLVKRPANLIVGRNERRLSGNFFSLKLTNVGQEGAALLGAGLWLHAGGQTGLGLGRYRLEVK